MNHTVLGNWSKVTCEFLCAYHVFRETEKAEAWAEKIGWKGVDELPKDLVQYFGVAP